MESIVPLGKTEGLAQFNKLNKKFTTVLGMIEDTSLLNHDLYYYAPVTIDINSETIIGTYDNFQVVSIHSLPTEITEEMIDQLARDKIVQKYPLERQLSIIGSLLEKIADASGIECEELKDMNDYIAEIKRTNAIRKEFYATNPDYRYLSTEEVEQIISEKYEGSIQNYDANFGTDH